LQLPLSWLLPLIRHPEPATAGEGSLFDFRSTLSHSAAPAFLFARLHQCLYQCLSVFISGDFAFPPILFAAPHQMTPSPKSLNMLATQMPEHIEDLQQRFAELNKRIQLVRSFL
jgi:hypothetical protein